MARASFSGELDRGASSSPRRRVDEYARRPYRSASRLARVGADRLRQGEVGHASSSTRRLTWLGSEMEQESNAAPHGEPVALRVDIRLQPESHTDFAALVQPSSSSITRRAVARGTASSCSFQPRARAFRAPSRSLGRSAHDRRTASTASMCDSIRSWSTSGARGLRAATSPALGSGATVRRWPDQGRGSSGPRRVAQAASEA
jgi:hypothetical protein